MFYLSHLFGKQNYSTIIDPIELDDLYMCLNPSPVGVFPVDDTMDMTKFAVVLFEIFYKKW